MSSQLPPSKKGKTKKQGEFKVVHAEVTIPVPPVFGQDLRAGVLEMLDSMIMRYSPFSFSADVLCTDDTL